MFPSIIDCRTYTSSFIKNGKDLCQPPVDILTCYNENLRLSILDSSKALSCVSELQCVSCAVMSDSLQPHGLQHARLLCPWNAPGKNTEWVAISFSRGPSQSRDWTGVSCTACRVFSIWATREAQHWACLWFVLLPAGQISFFFFDCAGSSVLVGFSLVAASRGYSSCSAWAARCGGFSCLEHGL